jgi:hypothetical protein
MIRQENNEKPGYHNRIVSESCDSLHESRDRVHIKNATKELERSLSKERAERMPQSLRRISGPSMAACHGPCAQISQVSPRDDRCDQEKPSLKVSQKSLPTQKGMITASSNEMAQIIAKPAFSPSLLVYTSPRNSDGRVIKKSSLIRKVRNLVSFQPISRPESANQQLDQVETFTYVCQQSRMLHQHYGADGAIIDRF